MSQAPQRKTALTVALLSMGLAMGAMAQNSGTSGTTGSSATTGTSAGSSKSGATSGAMSGGSSSTSRGASDAKLAHGDRKFMEEAAQHGMAEVQLGQLAAQKAQSEEVKRFGQRMVDDHGKANDQLKQLASSKGVDLPTDIDRAHRRDHDKLSKLSGADFDREYMKNMVSDHKKDVKDFQKEAKGAKDADVKSFASSTLPTLEQHLQMAQQTDAAVRTASRGGNTMRTSNSNNASSSGVTSSGASSGSTSGMSSGSASGSNSGSSSSGTSGNSSTSSAAPKK